MFRKLYFTLLLLLLTLLLPMGRSDQVCGERQVDLGATLRVVWKSSELEISWNVWKWSSWELLQMRNMEYQLAISCNQLRLLVLEYIQLRYWPSRGLIEIPKQLKPLLSLKFTSENLHGCPIAEDNTHTMHWIWKRQTWRLQHYILDSIVGRYTSGHRKQNAETKSVKKYLVYNLSCLKNMLWQRWTRTCESRKSMSNFI